jgi:protein-S-isoprenylcysteine O-methyltransferase Ste14
MLDPLLVLLAVGAYSVVHSLLASLGVKRRVRARFGPAVDRVYRLGYNLFAIVSFLPVLAILAWRPGVQIYRLDLPWAAVAVAGQLSALALLAAGVLQTDAWSFLGLRQLTQSGETPPRLVVTGLYRWVRHPLYTAGLLFLWCSPVMTTSLLALYLALTAYVIVGSRLEERRLLAEFGQAYSDYRAVVPALIPRPPRSRIARHP